MNLDKEFDGLSIEELKKVAERIKVKLKDKKAALNEENRQKLLLLEEGAKLKVTFKGEEVSAKFVYVTRSRFTVLINETKKSIMFNKLVSIY